MRSKFVWLPAIALLTCCPCLLADTIDLTVTGHWDNNSVYAGETTDLLGDYAAGSFSDVPGQLPASYDGGGNGGLFNASLMLRLPEPCSWALLGSGLLGLAVKRRTRAHPHPYLTKPPD